MGTRNNFLNEWWNRLGIQIMQVYTVNENMYLGSEPTFHPVIKLKSFTIPEELHGSRYTSFKRMLENYFGVHLTGKDSSTEIVLDGNFSNARNLCCRKLSRYLEFSNEDIKTEQEFLLFAEKAQASQNAAYPATEAEGFDMQIFSYATEFHERNADIPICREASFNFLVARPDTFTTDDCLRILRGLHKMGFTDSHMTKKNGISVFSVGGQIM